MTYLMGATELNDMTRQLEARFVTQVKRELEAFSSESKVSIEHVPSDSGVDMQMFNLVVKLESPIDLGELATIAEHFIQYCSNDKEAMRLTDGRLAALGDGDDLGAAWFEGGAIRVWLRVWRVGNDYGLGRCI